MCDHLPSSANTCLHACPIIVQYIHYFLQNYLSFIEFTSGPDNQTVEVDGMNFIENCVVLNATGVEWMDVKQHTVGDVTCCEDLMITMAICERRKKSKYGSVKNI